MNKNDANLMKNMFKIILFDAGILGTSLLDLLARNKNLSLEVVDPKNISYEDVSSGAYPKKYFGRSRVEILKEQFDEDVRFVNKKINNMKKNDLTDADLIVATSDSFNLEENNRLNELAFNSDKQLLTARLIEDGIGEVGPLIIPKQTACFKCYETRIRANVDDAENYFKKKISFGDSEKLMKLNSLKQIISSVLSLEVNRITKNQPKIMDKVISIDLNKHSMNENILFRIPNCQICDKNGTV